MKPNPMNNTLKCIQFNARGLNKDFKNEFKTYLNQTQPDVVLLSETWWTDNYVPTFSNYKNGFLNREIGKGGVALLVKKDLQMARIPVKQFLKSKIVDVSVTISTKTKIHIYSIYCPDGNESILNLLYHLPGRTNPCIIGGDFNGHSPRWFNSHLSNKIGREISNFLTNSDNFTLLTPKNLPTRIYSVTMKKSTLDLTIMSTQLALCSSIKLGPYLGSDHLPIVFRLLTKEKIIKQKIQLKWKFKEKEWPKWNESITRKLAEKKYIESGKPKLAFSIFHKFVLES